MIRKRLYIVSLLFSILNINLFSQVDCVDPLPPELTLVSVPDSAFVELRWNLSTSTGISANIIYQYDTIQYGWRAIDTINPEITRYVFRNGGTERDSMSFRVAAFISPIVEGGQGCPSKLSNILNTMFLSAKTDTCNAKISLKWNPYREDVTGYSIVVSKNNIIYETITLPPDNNNYALTNIDANLKYSFLIRASTKSGTFATSNIVKVFTRMKQPPLWINADFASIIDDGISLSFTSDPSSDINKYILEKRTNNSDWIKTADLTSVNGNVGFIDKESDKTIINYYRVAAINGCKLPSIYSNQTSNIVLNLDATNENLNLRWNQPERLTQSVLFYELYLNPGTGFYNLSSTRDTSYALDLSGITHLVTGNEVCFYIKASESGNPFGINSQINSEIVCYTPDEVITVPTLFTPNNDGLNDLFSPVFSFTPSEYLLIVSDRQGKVIFESRDSFEKWDGASVGRKLNEGVYLWKLKVKSPSGKNILRTGTITITY
ncbi:MAG TPA: gliding motility-associated C-terminal domain-containing protein [Bacteroidales bacterium]|nr:gliding motility-associated C-terminal domain-containing protein [Bacteroidales bacterium]